MPAEKAGMWEWLPGIKSEKPEKPTSFGEILKGVEQLAERWTQQEIDSAEQSAMLFEIYKRNCRV